MDLDHNNEISFPEFVDFMMTAEGDDGEKAQITKEKSKTG